MFGLRSRRPIRISSLLSGRHASTKAGRHASKKPKDMLEDMKVKFGQMGVVSHKKVGVRDIFKILKQSHTEKDYRSSLLMMNMFYNFGVPLKHRELSSRLLAAAMRCGLESEAVDLIKHYSTWLPSPPSQKLVCTVMNHFLDKGELLIVRDIAKAVREDWQMQLSPALYIIAINAMLRLPNDPVEEAMALYDDARRMYVSLPCPVHVKILNAAIKAFEASGEDAIQHLRTGLRVVDCIEADGFLRKGANAATLCSLSWFHWHLGALSDIRRAELPGLTGPSTFEDGDWGTILETAIENFGCHWGFSAVLPQRFFRMLENSGDTNAQKLVELARARFGRFYPEAS